MKKPKVGILTWHDPTNCGSTLQAYALYLYLQKQGIDTSIINYIPQWCRSDYMQMPVRMLSFKKKIKRFVKNSLLPCYYYLPKNIQKKINPFYSFYRHYCKMTTACVEESIPQVCKQFTTIISGSDQIWNPNFIDPIFLQKFVDNDINKISFAASLGGRNLPKELEELYKNSLQSFNAVSVREDAGCQLLESIGVKALIHIDPTLLISVSHYRAISHCVPNIKKPFAFCYFLSTDREYKAVVQKYVKQHNIMAVGHSANTDDYQWMQEVRVLGPLEWLWLADNADIVLTNSYHATIFSLIFKTPFYTFTRFSLEDPICQNSRIEQLDAYFNIADYLIEKDIPEQLAYPFSRFEERLPALQKSAHEYLMKNVK